MFNKLSNINNAFLTAFTLSLISFICTGNKVLTSSFAEDQQVSFFNLQQETEKSDISLLKDQESQVNTTNSFDFNFSIIKEFIYKAYDKVTTTRYYPYMEVGGNLQVLDKDLNRNFWDRRKFKEAKENYTGVGLVTTQMEGKILGLECSQQYTISAGLARINDSIGFNVPLSQSSYTTQKASNRIYIQSGVAFTMPSVLPNNISLGFYAGLQKTQSKPAVLILSGCLSNYVKDLMKVTINLGMKLARKQLDVISFEKIERTAFVISVKIQDVNVVNI